MKKHVVFLFTALAIVLAAVPAYADNPNVNMDDFTPSVHAWDIGNILTTRIAPDFTISGGLWLTYRKNALSVAGPTVAGDAQLVSDQLVGDLYAAIPFAKIISVGVDIPVFFVSSGDDPSSVVASMQQADGASLGDIRLSGKVKFWNNKNVGIGVGLAQDISVPTATGDKFTGEDTVTSNTKLLVDYSKQGWSVAANIGYFARKNESGTLEPAMGDEMQMGIGVQVPIICDRLEALGTNLTRTYAGAMFESEAHTSSAFLAGLRARPFMGLVLIGMGGASLGTMPGTPEWQAMLNVGWEPLPSSCDLDKDGLCDSNDKCPNVAGPKESGGCPDKDGDGILDADDRCPSVKGQKKTAGCPDRDRDGLADYQDSCPDNAGPVESKGCPDKDGDGILDQDDACPEEAGTNALKGCPDSDGDGITNADDKCPDEAGPKSTSGCPDMDKDGIADLDDKCPDVFGKKEFNGCPPPTPKKIQITKKKIVILEKVFFKTARATIKSESLPLLNDVATVLKDNAWIKKVQVEGHTDDLGRLNYNLKLSQSRAEEVVKHLIGQGVSAERLEAVGYGPNKPLDPAKTKEARANNRRVEFTILDPK